MFINIYNREFEITFEIKNDKLLFTYIDNNKVSNLSKINVNKLLFNDLMAIYEDKNKALNIFNGIVIKELEFEIRQTYNMPKPIKSEYFESDTYTQLNGLAEYSYYYENNCRKMFAIKFEDSIFPTNISNDINIITLADLENM
jgi:hypothetical protein